MNGKASRVDHIPNIGKLSENTIKKATKLILDKFKGVGIEIADEKQKIVDLLQNLNISEVIQNPRGLYFAANSGKIYTYGNVISLHCKRDLDPFFKIGFDSKGVIDPSPYNMENIANQICPGGKILKPCGLGLRVEIEAKDQVGNNAVFPHIINEGYAYDQPLIDELRDRCARIIYQCQDKQTGTDAVELVISAIKEKFPDTYLNPENFTIVGKVNNVATHIKINSRYNMMTNTGREVFAIHSFGVNIKDDKLSLVEDDVKSFSSKLTSDNVRRDAFRKNKEGIKLSQLAFNIFQTLSPEDIEDFMATGLISKKHDEYMCSITAKKLTSKTSISFLQGRVDDLRATLNIPVPYSLCDSYVGESMRKVIDHPLITDDMIITKVDHKQGFTLFSYKSPKILYKE